MSRPPHPHFYFNLWASVVGLFSVFLLYVKLHIGSVNIHRNILRAQHCLQMLAFGDSMASQYANMAIKVFDVRIWLFNVSMLK